jgi:hypothetical protein
LKKFAFKPPIIPVYSAPLKTDEPNPPVLKKPVSNIVKKRPAKFGN